MRSRTKSIWKLKSGKKIAGNSSSSSSIHTEVLKEWKREAPTLFQCYVLLEWQAGRQTDTRRYTQEERETKKIYILSNLLYNNLGRFPCSVRIMGKIYTNVYSQNNISAYVIHTIAHTPSVSVLYAASLLLLLLLLLSATFRIACAFRMRFQISFFPCECSPAINNTEKKTTSYVSDRPTHTHALISLTLTYIKCTSNSVCHHRNMVRSFDIPHFFFFKKRICMYHPSMCWLFVLPFHLCLRDQHIFFLPPFRTFYFSSLVARSLYVVWRFVPTTFVDFECDCDCERVCIYWMCLFRAHHQFSN